MWRDDFPPRRRRPDGHRSRSANQEPRYSARSYTPLPRDRRRASGHAALRDRVAAAAAFRTPARDLHLVRGFVFVLFALLIELTVADFHDHFELAFV